MVEFLCLFNLNLPFAMLIRGLFLDWKLFILVSVTEN